MAPRIPTKTDFQGNLTVDIVPPTNNQRPVNVLVLLHGIGDTQIPFTRLGQQLNLPETCCLSVRGIQPLPSLFVGSDSPSFHWGDDVLFDEGKGEIELNAGFEKAKEVLWRDLLEDGLFKNCGYKPRDVVFYGFGQGAMVALALVAGRNEEFGGVVSVGGSLRAAPLLNGKKSKTPILICGGSRSREVTRTGITALKDTFEAVEYVKWTKGEDGMPATREEMLPIMKFFARRLRSRSGVPDGAVEL